MKYTGAVSQFKKPSLQIWRFFPEVLIFFLFLHKNKLWCSLEAPQGGASNEYPQHMFLWRNKKTIHSYLELWKKHNSGKNLFYKKVLVFFLFLQKNLYVVGSLWNQLTVTVSNSQLPFLNHRKGRMSLDMISWSNLHESYVAEQGFELATPGSAMRCTMDCAMEPSQ